MWSGPRNISTALLRSWGNRPDTSVCDEPLYAHYLLRSGAAHPGRELILAGQENDWRSVVRDLTGPVPGGRPIYYQKHMAHHLFPDMLTEWLNGFRHVFLIRDPEEMITSLIKVLPDPEVRETGLPQQWDLFRREVERTGRTPPVLDARDVLENPEGLLRGLCAAVGVAFVPAMLSWPDGPRDTDGVWAPMWYGAVERSTGFHPYRPKPDRVPKRLRGMLEVCREVYEKLYLHRLSATDAETGADAHTHDAAAAAGSTADAETGEDTHTHEAPGS